MAELICVLGAGLDLPISKPGTGLERPPGLVSVKGVRRPTEAPPGVVRPLSSSTARGRGLP